MINKLDEGLVSHLAAGEVIERPSSIIRECIDNSIDAKSTSISITTIDGGKDVITVEDNGCGIHKDDLNAIALPHATSKITSLDDIYNIITMGFRGEALFSMTSAGDLKIESNGYGIEIDDFKRSDVFKSTKDSGTRITLSNLFKNLPARLAFLSSANIEHQRNASIISEKALAFPEVEFTYINNNIKYIHYDIETPKDRVGRFLKSESLSKVKEIEKEYDDFNIKLFYLDGGLRRDRKKIKIYVNKRCVTDPYLMSAILYAFSSVTPGAFYPEALLFIENDPSLTDFNVHPQKKECRLRNAHSIHHEISTIFKGERLDKIRSIYDFKESQNETQSESVITSKDSDCSGDNYSGERHDNPINNDTVIKTEQTDDAFTRNNKNSIVEPTSFRFPTSFLSTTEISKKDREPYEMNPMLFSESTNDETLGFTYIGQIWNLFLLYTIGDELFIIDQHAAAERVMFDSLKKRINIQELLFPLNIEVDINTSRSLDRIKDSFIEKGIIIEKVEDCLWCLKAIPNARKNSEREIIKLIEKADDKEIDAKLYAITSCHNSIRGGMALTRSDAIALISDTLKLDELVCPHGRSFVTKITKSELEALVLRE